MSEILDKKIGDNAEVKLEQLAGKLSLEVDITQPISVGGVELGKIEGKVILSIDELAVVEALAAKYPAGKAVLDFLKKELLPAPTAEATTQEAPAAQS